MFKEKKFKAAQDAYQEILDTYQDLSAELKASVYFNLGLCYARLRPDMPSMQEHMYSLALSLQPDYEKARVRRARVYMAEEKWQEALDDLRKSGRD